MIFTKTSKKDFTIKGDTQAIVAILDDLRFASSQYDWAETSFGVKGTASFKNMSIIREHFQALESSTSTLSVAPTTTSATNKKTRSSAPMLLSKAQELGLDHGKSWVLDWDQWSWCFPIEADGDVVCYVYE